MAFSMKITNPEKRLYFENLDWAYLKTDRWTWILQILRTRIESPTIYQTVNQ